MLKNIKYIRMMKAVRYSMITMSLVLCFISVSCRNEDTVSEQFFDEDAVTVRLNLTTRGVETGDSDLLDELSSDPFQWFKTGTLFPQAPAQPRIALMIFNRDLNRYVYNQLLPFNSTGVDGQYQINIRIPKGETEFYALYAPNQTGKDLPYYTPEGNLQNKIPWDFLGAGTEEISKEEFAGAAFPAIIKEQQDGSLGLPVNNPYDGVTPSPADEKIIDEIVNSLKNNPDKTIKVILKIKKGKLKDFKIDLGSLAEVCNNEKFKSLELIGWGLNDKSFEDSK